MKVIDVAGTSGQSYRSMHIVHDGRLLQLIPVTFLVNVKNALDLYDEDQFYSLFAEIHVQKLTRTHFSRMQTTRLLNSMGCIKLEGHRVFSLTLLCDLDHIDGL